MIAALGCMKAPTSSYTATSDLTPDFSISISSGSVLCRVTFMRNGDPTHILLESDAQLTCNGKAMYIGGSAYFAVLPIETGKEYRIYVVRPKMGSTVVSDKTVF